MGQQTIMGNQIGQQQVKEVGNHGSIGGLGRGTKTKAWRQLDKKRRGDQPFLSDHKNNWVEHVAFEILVGDQQWVKHRVRSSTLYPMSNE